MLGALNTVAMVTCVFSTVDIAINRKFSEADVRDLSYVCINIIMVEIIVKYTAALCITCAIEE